MSSSGIGALPYRAWKIAPAPGGGYEQYLFTLHHSIQAARCVLTGETPSLPIGYTTLPQGGNQLANAAVASEGKPPITQTGVAMLS